MPLRSILQSRAAVAETPRSERKTQNRVVALFTGKGPHARDYRRGATIKFDKGSEPKYIELQIKDSAGKLQPEFEVKVWQ